jgi:hypothetical protein
MFDFNKILPAKPSLKKAMTGDIKIEDNQNSRILNSTLLFLALPADVALSAIG